MKSVWSIDSTSLQFMLKRMVCAPTRFFLQSFLSCLFWFCWNWHNMVTYEGLLWIFFWNFIDLYDQTCVTCQYPNVEDLQVVQLNLLKDFQTQIWVLLKLITQWFCTCKGWFAGCLLKDTLTWKLSWWICSYHRTLFEHGSTIDASGI
jgi:hypothetical protein